MRRLIGVVMATESATSPTSPADQSAFAAPCAMPERPPTYQVPPVGSVRKVDGRATIAVHDEYRPALFAQLDAHGRDAWQIHLAA